MASRYNEGQTITWSKPAKIRCQEEENKFCYSCRQAIDHWYTKKKAVGIPPSVRQSPDYMQVSKWAEWSNISLTNLVGQLSRLAFVLKKATRNPKSNVTVLRAVLSKTQLSTLKSIEYNPMWTSYPFTTNESLQDYVLAYIRRFYWEEFRGRF